MSGIFSKPNIPPPPKVDPGPAIPQASDREVLLAKQKGVAKRMKSGGRQATALTGEKVGL